MDLFLNNSIISENSESNVLLETYFVDFNKNAAVTVHRKEAVSLLSLLQWFIKCSAIEKHKYLVRLANELSLGDLMDVIKPIKLLFGKAFVLNETTNGTVCIDDKVLNDDNINLASKTLYEVQEQDFNWFYQLERLDQVEVILGLTKVLGVGSCRKLYQRLLRMYRTKHIEESQIVEYIGAGDNTSQENGVDESNGSEYVATGEFHTTVVSLRKHWTELIAKYRLEVFGKPAAVKRSKTHHNSVTHTQKETVKPASGKQKQLGADKQRLDQLQLLPLFISWKILGYLDNKTLQTAQQVNAYWSFAVCAVLNERTTRVALGKMMDKMAERLLSSSNVEQKQPPILALSSYNGSALGQCDRRLQRLLERGTAIAALRRPAPSTDYCVTSLLQDVYEQTHFPYGSFVLPTEGVRVFGRCVPPVPPEELLVSAGVQSEYGVQWLEGAPASMAFKRPIVKRQVATLALGRKVEAALTRNSSDSLHSTHTNTLGLQQYNAISSKILRPNDQQQPWYSTFELDGELAQQPQILDSNDVLNNLNNGPHASETSTRPDAETVLRSFERRISEYSTRLRMTSTIDP